jgi:tetratricopeptide (TPR) repeat protein
MALPAKLKKHVLLRIPLGEIFAAMYMTVFLCAMLYNAIACLLAAHTFLGVTSLFLFFGLLWLWIPPLVACVLRFHFWIHMHDRQYARIDLAYWRATNALKYLGRPLYLEIITSDLATMRLAQGYYDSAVALYQEALKSAEVTKPQRNQRRFHEKRLAMFKRNLATALFRNHRPIEAELLCEEALEKLGKEKEDPTSDVFRANTHNTIASIRLDLGELDSAEEHLNAARDIWEGLGSKQPFPKALLHSYIAPTWLLLASLYLERNDLARADHFCDLALTLLKEDDLAFPSLQLKNINRLAEGYITRESFKRAEQLLEISYQIASELPFHPDSQNTLTGYEKLLRLTDRQNEIADMRSYLKLIETEKADPA